MWEARSARRLIRLPRRSPLRTAPPTFNTFSQDLLVPQGHAIALEKVAPSRDRKGAVADGRVGFLLFSRESLMPPSGGTAKNENYFPFEGGAGDVLWRTCHCKPEGRPPTPPLIGGIFGRVIHAARRHHQG